MTAWHKLLLSVTVAGLLGVGCNAGRSRVATQLPAQDRPDPVRINGEDDQSERLASATERVVKRVAFEAAEDEASASSASNEPVD